MTTVQIMESADDTRDSKMWEKEIIVTSQQLLSFAACYVPMGVYIPKGRVKVPHRRSRMTCYTPPSSKVRPLSHHLLKIKSQTLPPIDVYRNCDVTNRPHQHYQETKILQSRSPDKRTVRPEEAVTAQHARPHCDVNNGTVYLPKQILPNNQPTMRPVLPPPYADIRLSNHDPFQPEVQTLMRQEVTYPFSHQYYQHLSAIAAMAWSDCNQATLKLKRIYEETAQLSRAYDPVAGYPDGIPTMQPPEYPGLPVKEHTAGLPHSTVHRTNPVACRHLTTHHQIHINQTMAQSRNHVDANLGFHVTKTPAGPIIRSPKAGVAMVDRQNQSVKPASYDVINGPYHQNAYLTRTVGAKHKIRDETMPIYPTKIPRLAQPVPNLSAKYGNVPTLQSLNDLIPALSTDPRPYECRPPPYERVQTNYTRFIPGALPYQPRTSTPKFLVASKNPGNDVMNTSSGFSDVMSCRSNSSTPNFLVASKIPGSDVTNNTSSRFSDLISLPSVSFSPTQQCISRTFMV